ncbi:hypothetical protein [Streptomyces sp. NPDC059076]|uniref:hypothetical protein n=1 Tax=unclassified Streptomyces TaxID=2593676 RepID=UPI0036AF45FB
MPRRSRATRALYAGDSSTAVAAVRRMSATDCGPTVPSGTGVMTGREVHHSASGAAAVVIAVARLAAVMPTGTRPGSLSEHAPMAGAFAGAGEPPTRVVHRLQAGADV